MIICSVCGRDIDAIGQDNMSYGSSPICEDCSRKTLQWLYSDLNDVIDIDYLDEEESLQ